MLLDKPLDSHPIEPNVELPSPACLKRKIIIKNKKKHHHHHHHKKDNNVNNTTINTSAINISFQQDEVSATPTGNGDVSHHPPPLQVNLLLSPFSNCGLIFIIFILLQQIRQSSKDSTGSSDTDSSSDDESIPGQTIGVPGSSEPDKVQQTKETEAGAEISALVNYVQPVHFSSFENAESK